LINIGLILSAQYSDFPQNAKKGVLHVTLKPKGLGHLYKLFFQQMIRHCHWGKSEIYTMEFAILSFISIDIVYSYILFPYYGFPYYIFPTIHPYYFYSKDFE
jgi:hypothetical protein